MRATTVVRRLLGVTNIFVKNVSFEGHAMVVRVTPTWRKPRCSGCGDQVPGYDRHGLRRWRHLSYGQTRVFLEYDLRRVDCVRCGVRVERVPWGGVNSGFTYASEELVAYLARATDKTAVANLMGIAWRTVGAIVDRVVSARLDSSRLDGLTLIGIDELSFKKRHNYVTVVVDHVRRRVVWAKEGKCSDTLAAFFDDLGPERLKALELATIDMSAAYKKALSERAPHVTVVFDRFHVQKLVSEALDEVRRDLVRELEGDEAATVKGSRYALLKNAWNLTRKQGQKLRDLQKNNAKLYRAYLLKEEFARVMDYRQLRRAAQGLREWLAWASRSKLAPMVKVARTIRDHLDGILGYVKHRITNAINEGFNRRARMTATRAYGFHGSAPLISMLFLCCGGIELHPPLP